MTRGKWLVLTLLVVLSGFLVVTRNARYSADVEVSATAQAAEETHNKEASSQESDFAGAAEQITAARSSEAPDSVRELQLFVRNQEQQPLAGAEIKVWVRGEKEANWLKRYNRTIFADSEGAATVPWVAAGLQQLELVVSMGDYASHRVTWTAEEIPSVHTVILSAGHYIGGIVVDEQGKPIRGAEVSIFRSSSARMNAGPAFQFQKQQTDAEGRWMARNIPEEVLFSITIRAEHPEYLEASMKLSTAELQSQCRAGDLTITLERWLVTHGRVLDESGNPIPDATVWVGRTQQERQSTTTDAQGRFAFERLKQGKVLFAATASGYSPASAFFEVEPYPAADIELRLKPGQVIRGVVVDKAGQPVEGVRVNLEDRPGERSYDGYEFTTFTDADGRFEWDSAPNQAMPFFFGKAGYQSKRRKILKPGEENVITLLGVERIKGRVIDFDSRQPVEAFEISTGVIFNQDQYFPKTPMVRFNDEEGAFTIDIVEEDYDAFEVRAEGYQDQVISLSGRKNSEAEMIVLLKRSVALTGVVNTVDGLPVAGAGVGIVDERPGGRSVRFSKLNLVPYLPTCMLVHTDTFGGFTFETPPEEGLVVAAAPQGFAILPIAEVRRTGAIVLQPYGRVEGVLASRVGSTAGQELQLTPVASRLMFNLTEFVAKTDAQGRFAIENVPPTFASISRLIEPVPGSRKLTSYLADFTVEPGKTTYITLGNEGATVMCRVVYEGDPIDGDYVVAGQLTSIPRNVLQGNAEADQNERFYLAPLGTDGSLLFEAITPGEYKLYVKLGRPETFYRSALASGELVVTVPAGSNPSAPLDMGEIVLRPVAGGK